MYILYSKYDQAGKNIADCIGRVEKKANILEVEVSLLNSDSIVEKIEERFIVFASRHKSESGKASFTIHVPGNWGIAEMGGKDREISFSDPLRMKAIAFLLNKEGKLDVSLEVDHHGPLCMKPCVFVEIGSSEKEWNNLVYAETAANAIIFHEDAMNELDVKEIGIGVGGGHYCPAFNKYEFDGNVAFAHIIPNYAVDKLEYSTFVQALERTTEEIDSVYIDWKGLKQEQRKKIIDFSNEYGIEYKRI